MYRLLIPTFLFLSLLFGMGNLHAQDAAKQTSSVPAPVIFKSDTLFLIYEKIGAFSPEQRAEIVVKNIYQLAHLPLSEFDSIKIIDFTSRFDIMYQQKVIASVNADDAKTAGKTINALATQYQTSIKTALIKDFNDTSISTLGKDILYFILALIGLSIVFKYVNRLFDYWRRNLRKIQTNIFFRNNKLIQLFTIITPETERGILLFMLRITRFTVLGLFLYFYLPFLFSQISFTRGFGERLFGYILSPIYFLGNSFITFLPKLLFIIVIVISVRYLLMAMNHIAQEVKKERITIAGFYPDWAIPTLNLAKSMVIIFTLVILFPYLPGAGSDAFQGVSVFVGLLLSLGSAGAISNIISGVILTYMRPFKTGDRVKINDITGDIVGKNLLVTRLKTLKNEEITIPNAALLGGGIVNYTSLADEHGLILHTSVTIGYDVPWKQVHELLIKAAQRTEFIEKDPLPFVLQTSLDDWYVAYQLNAYSKQSHKIPRIYSELHSHIQDTFNEAGVEIMSSHYLAMRDGNAAALPTSYLPEDYLKPAFKVDSK